MQRSGQPRMAIDVKSLMWVVVVMGWVAVLALPTFAQDDEGLGVDIEKLEFEWEQPKTVVIYPGSRDIESTSDASESGRVYWYLPYRLTYKGEEETKFFVSLRATSDKRRNTIPAYRDLVLPHVEKKIERLEQRELISKADLINDSKTDELRYVTYGPNESKQCVAIFNPLDPEADEIRIYVHGLVNDIKVENLGDGKFRIEERVLMITFERPGDEIYPTLDDIKFVSKKWITLSVTTPDEG